ncbi:efflux RND transporter permease subunit [Pseudoroseicyclus aestuarii]|uniref:HAE1 family hydrophobic/amphiphilic exporter-1 n=1 Tax=Pseudoroseicyclus aestuarii TaxID=1795041 RepID=A0A318SVS1_9RHOB|nr:efflux RND transporter permease subunit [Pseudoroseicyclus aestuarii]PYE85592.1 HAE1 family hydrophobic/amphiphilic exporter-1 [Pseudoroseicyclus aestuarii]
MFLTRISVNQPVFATMIMVALMVIGGYAFTKLPIEQYPDIEFPVVAVVVSYPGAAPEAVEADVIEPIEDSVNTISGIDSIQSTAQSGQALVVMQFDMDVDTAVAVQDVRDNMASVRPTLPDGADDPLVLRFDPAELPIISVALSSETMAPRDLTELAEDTIAQQFSVIDGVGRASVVGGVPRQLEILLDPDRMTAFGIGVTEVVGALSSENRDLPAGSVDLGREEQSLQVAGQIEQRDEFLDLIVARRGGQPVRLGDIATLEEGEASIDSLAVLDGRRALAIDVVKTQGSNTVAVAEAIREKVAELNEDGLPEGVTLEVVRDNSVSVEESYENVQDMLIEGAVLATLIVFLFLNSWRSTVITGLTLPISIIGTMTLIWVLGFTLNLMTLLALSLAVGLLIDDAIVVRENIMRHLHMGKSHRQAALDGTNEIGLAVLATTLSIVAVFLPVAFMEGIIGQFFLQFGVTVSVAVLISLFVAFTLDPMMSSVWYDPAGDPDRKRGPVGRLVNQFDRGFEWLSRRYLSVLRWSLKHRLATLGIALGAFIGSFFLAPLVGVEFIPAADEGEFQVQIETPPGSSLDYTAMKIAQVDGVLRDFDEVTGTYATVNSGTSASGTNTATIIAAMTPSTERERTPVQMVEPVRRALASIPGIDPVVSAAGGLGGVSKPVVVNLYGDDIAVLERLAQQLAEEMRGIDGLLDVESSLAETQPILSVEVDRDAASDLGLSLAQIGNALSPMLGGEEVTDWTAPDARTFTVVVQLPEAVRNDLDRLRALPIAPAAADATGGTGGAQMITLDQVARITQGASSAEINRLDLTRQVEVSANLAAGTTLGAVGGPVQAAIAAVDTPPGYRISSGGEAEDLAEAGTSAATALLLAVIFIYLVLASQFGSFLQPVAIMAALPLSLIGVMLGLLVGGSTLNMFSVIGFIMLMGLVVKNAILLVDNANQHTRAGWTLYDALVEAGMTRFRPIVMTTLAMIFGMLPLALNIHGGSGQNAPMAHAVIGGLISSTLLTLVVVPVALTYVAGFTRVVQRFTPKAPDDGAHAAPDQA